MSIGMHFGMPTACCCSLNDHYPAFDLCGGGSVFMFRARVCVCGISILFSD